MILFLIAFACLVCAQRVPVNSGERARLEIALRPLVSTNHFDVPYSCPYETYFVECDSMGHITFANFAYSDLDVRGLFVELLALLRLYVNFCMKNERAHRWSHAAQQHADRNRVSSQRVDRRNVDR